MSTEFTVETEALGETVTVRVAGELDMATAPQLGEELDRIAADPPPVVVVELAGVTFLGSAGLGVLVQARRDLLQRASRLVLAKVSDGLMRVFQIVRLDRTFEFDPPATPR